MGLFLAVSVVCLAADCVYFGFSLLAISFVSHCMIVLDVKQTLVPQSLNLTGCIMCIPSILTVARFLFIYHGWKLCVCNHASLPILFYHQQILIQEQHSMVMWDCGTYPLSGATLIGSLFIPAAGKVFIFPSWRATSTCN
jgi:hypothetical protein